MTSKLFYVFGKNAKMRVWIPGYVKYTGAWWSVVSPGINFWMGQARTIGLLRMDNPGCVCVWPMFKIAEIAKLAFFVVGYYQRRTKDLVYRQPRRILWLDFVSNLSFKMLKSEIDQNWNNSPASHSSYLLCLSPAFFPTLTSVSL